MQFVESIKRATGDFYLEVFRRGELIEVVSEPNLVVSSSRNILASLLGGGSGSIAKFGVGTNGSAPSVGNASLTGLVTAPIGTVDYPGAGQVRFGFGLDGTQANGMSISEFGLLTATEVLFARKVRAAPLSKTADISFSGLWTITFEA